MTSPSCYVIGADEWNSAMSSLGVVLLLLFFMVWAMSIDWLGTVEFWRRQLRRRRLRAIRASRERSLADDVQ